MGPLERQRPKANQPDDRLVFPCWSMFSGSKLRHRDMDRRVSSMFPVARLPPTNVCGPKRMVPNMGTSWRMEQNENLWAALVL